MTGGVLQNTFNGYGNGGIGINGYSSVSGGLISISTSAAYPLTTASLGLSGGTMDMSGGTISADSNVVVGSIKPGLFNQSGGLVTCGGSLGLGTTGTGGGTVNLSGGTLDLSVGDGNLYNGYANSSTVNISGTALAIVPTFNMGYAPLANASSAVVNTLNLNGGTLETNSLVASGTASNIVNINGGHLISTGGTDNFLSGMTHVYVQAGGAKIDDGGNFIEISQNLQSGASPDGGRIGPGRRGSGGRASQAPGPCGPRSS